MRYALKYITSRPILAGALGSALIALLAAGWAGAQAGAPASRPSVETKPVGTAEQLAQAERALSKGKAAAQRIQGLMDESRRERDLIRMTCLSDKLAQYNAGIKNLEERIGNLRDAIEAGDTGRANHEYTVTTVIAQKQEVLSREVNQCIGQDLYETGDTKVEFSIVGDVPGDDPTRLFEAGPYGIPLVPPPVSPLR